MTAYIIESPPKVAARPDPAIYIPSSRLAYSKAQKLFAEFFGTFALVMFSAGAICADHFPRNTNETGLGLLGISLAYGLTYGAMIVAVGRVSGGHLNPAVTIGYWRRRLVARSWRRICCVTLCRKKHGALRPLVRPPWPAASPGCRGCCYKA